MLTNITDPLTAAGSILHIVTTGVQLATTLQTYMELAREAEHELHDIVFDVNATAAALKQLHTIIDADRDLSDRTVAVFKDDGVREVEMLALKCHAIYNNVAILIQRASHSDSADADRDRSSSSVPAAAADQAALDPTTLRPLTLMGKLRWPWLRPRILRCREQLNWLKVSLLFTLQIANIAQWQMSGKRHAETSCEAELRQQTARQLQKRRNSMLRGFAGIEAEECTQDGPQRPVTSSSGAESVLGVVFTTTKESTEDKITTPTLDLDGPSQQRSTTYCTPIGAENSRADVNTHPTTSRSLMSEQGLPEIRDASVLPEFLNGRLDAFAITSAPTTTFLAKRSVPAPGEAVSKSDNLSRHPTALKPTANTRSGEPSVIVDQLPSYLNHWADRVFGRQSKYRSDKQSTTLEAYIAENLGRDVPIKVPFGHERLMYGLDKVLKDWRGDQWSNYLAASPLTRLALDAISEAARKASSHEKTCLAFKEYSTQGLPTPFMLVFFSLEKAKDPVILSFNGRRYSIPFAACQTLHSMEERIREVCCSSSASASLPTFIAEKRYEFADKNDNIILHSFLIESIQPGMELSLLPRRMFIETPSEADTRPLSTMTREPQLHKPTSHLERRGWSDTLEHREQVEAGESGEPLSACLSMDVPKRVKAPISVRLRSALGRIPYGAESYLWSLGWKVDLRWMYRPRRRRMDDEPSIHCDSANAQPYNNPAAAQSHDFLPSLPMNYMGYAPPAPPGPPPAPVPGPRTGYPPGLLGPAESGNRYNTHEGDRTFANTPVMLIPRLESPGEAPPCLPPPIEPVGDGSGPRPQSRRSTLLKNWNLPFVASTFSGPAFPCSTNGVDSEAQSLDDDLDLDVLDVGVEIIKGDMSIDKWLEQMTNVGCAGNEAIATAELSG